MDFDTVIAESNGKWVGIFSKMGIEVGTGKHCPCPACGGKDRFRFIDKDGRGEYICNACGAGTGFQLIQRVLGISFKEACETVNDIMGTVEPMKYQKETTTTPEALRKIFKSSRKITKGDIVYTYLRSRGLSLIPNNIRTTLKCWEPETKTEVPAMLAIFQLPDGTAVTMHRTYLTKDGQKMKLDSPKKILPALKPMVGGAVRLFNGENTVLGVAEGIETAIAVTELTKIPCWATLSTALMMGWEPPPDVNQVIVYGDSDKNYAGAKAAYTLANRLVIKNKLTVDVEIPAKPGTDFLDELNRIGG